MSDVNEFDAPPRKEKPFIIETEAILSGYDHEDMTVFVHDLILLFTLVQHIDQDYGELDNPRLDKDIERFRDVVEEWNKKYRDLLLTFRVKTVECTLEVYVKDSKEHIVRIISSMKRFESMHGNITAVFKGINSPENTLTLHPAKNLWQLIYAKEDMLDPRSPEFRLCAYYALKDGFDRSIDLQRYDSEFSFDVTSEEALEHQYGWSTRYPFIRFGPYR